MSIKLNSDFLAVVTGASRGNGKAIATAFETAGAIVVRVDIQECNSKNVCFIGDVSDQKLIDSVKKYCLKQKFKSFVLVNNAGITSPHSFPYPRDFWDKTISINLTAPFHLSQLVADSMRENNWGRIINIASLQSLRAFDNSIPYGASKGGIMQLTRALAQAYSKDGVLVNAIAPGFFRTNLTESLFQDPGKLQTLADKTMMGRNGEEKDIFGISVFLCSDANSYVTGQTIFLDGGFSAA